MEPMPTVTVPTLAGARVLLRALRPDDLEVFGERERDPEIVRMLGGEAADAGRRPTPEEARRWYESVSTSTNPHEWIIDVGGRHVGSCRLFNPVEWDRRASYAIGISEPALLGRGLGREASALVLDHAFGPAGLHRVELQVLAYNTRAIACYRACGFVEEGRQRQAARVDGAWYDFVLMAILEDTWRTRRPQPSPAQARL